MLKTPPQHALEKQLINTFVGNHDLICMCDNPAYHSLQILIKQLKPELKQEEIKQLQLCLGEETTTTAANAEDTGIDIGDLEKLFGEDDAGEDVDNR